MEAINSTFTSGHQLVSVFLVEEEEEEEQLDSEATDFGSLCPGLTDRRCTQLYL
jgi:hypothetical protein